MVNKYAKVSKRDLDGFDLHQVETELKYSKRMKSFIILDSFINEVPHGIFRYMSNAIDNFKQGEYFPEKRYRVAKLPDTEHIVYEIFIAILSNYQPRAIQGVAIQLGSALGYDDIVTACKIGSELLAVTTCDLFDINVKDEGVDIVPKLKVDKATEHKLKSLCYMPPSKKAPVWETNTGGWEWERKSVILGHLNHHNKKQALDALNKIQEIGWRIDPEVLSWEENTNKEMDKQQFSSVVKENLDEEFYFVWRYDKRGRMYSSGYDLNPQSNEYGKALLSPAKAEVCTEDGIQALKIAIAGHAGQDKRTWEDRLDWFKCKSVIGWEWKEPILGRKAERAYIRACAGEPINYFMQIDATSSFAQVIACLTGCKKTASLCNLVNTGKRENLYQSVQDEMEKLCGDDVPDTKYPTMTHSYNSKAVPKQVFNEEQLEAFYKVMDGLLPGCEQFMEACNEMWNPMALDHTWTLPDGHVAHCKVTEMKEIRIRVDELDGRRFYLRYEQNMPSDNYRSLAANITHSVDGYVNREMIHRCDFELSTIHDCWQFHPNHFEEVKQTYREILADVADSNLLSDIFSEIAGKQISINKLSDDLSLDILDSEYALS